MNKKKSNIKPGGDANVDENSQQHFIKHIVRTLRIHQNQNKKTINSKTDFKQTKWHGI